MKAVSHIRWMIRKDLPEVLAIENAAFEFPWKEDDFIRCLRQRTCIGMVAEHENRVAGYMVFRLHRTRIQLLNFAVRPDLWRLGIGREMVAKLKKKLSEQRRERLCLEVRESNLDAQLFWRAMGFRAVNIVHHFFNTGEDAFLFRFNVHDRISTQPRLFKNEECCSTDER